MAEAREGLVSCQSWVEMAIDWRDIKPNNPIDIKKKRDWWERRDEAEKIADKIKRGIQTDVPQELIDDVQIILLRRYLKSRKIDFPDIDHPRSK